MVASPLENALEQIDKTARMLDLDQGITETVTKDGNLILRHADGSLSNIAVGDVTIIKN